MAPQVKQLRLLTSAFFTIAGLWAIKDSIKLTFIEYVTYAPNKGDAQSIVVFENGAQGPNLPPVDESNPAVPKSVLCSWAVFDLEYEADKYNIVQEFINNNPDSVIIHKEETTESVPAAVKKMPSPRLPSPPPSPRLPPPPPPPPLPPSPSPPPKRSREEECKPTPTDEGDQDPYALDSSKKRWKAVLNNMQIVGSEECVRKTIAELKKGAKGASNNYMNYGTPLLKRGK
jgi:hypothetical protein